MRKWLLGIGLLISLTALFLQGGSARNATAATDEPHIRLTLATFDPLVDGEPEIPPALQAAPDSSYVLLQFHGPIETAAIHELQTAGVIFYGYIPDFAYAARLTAATQEEITQHAAVRWIGLLHPAYKLNPYAAGGTLLVEHFPDALTAEVEAALTAVGATVLRRNDDANLIIVDAPGALLPLIAALEEVRWLQNLAPLQEFNDDARWVSQSAVQNLTPLHERGLDGRGQVGAVADSGLAVYDYYDGEPLLYNPVPSCYFLDDGGNGGTARLPGPDHRKVVAYEVPPGSGGDQIDSTGHGSHVVGSLAGDQAPWDDRSTADGQAYAARVYFQDIGRGVGFAENLLGEIVPPDDYAVLFGQAYDPNGDGVYQAGSEPRTHSNSWGGQQPIYSAETAQTDAFMWHHPDFLILFAAGNQGPGPSTVGYPATAKNIVTVGATENGRADFNSMGYYSSHGPAPTGRLKPTVSAPGDRIHSALRGNPCASTSDRQGTSMATPIVHGVALLMRQYLTEGFYPSGAPNPADSHHPSAALLKALLMNSGRPADGLYTDNAGGGAWPSNGQGWGRVTADDALYFQGDHRALWLHDEYDLNGSTGFDGTGQSRTFTFELSDGRPWRTEPLEITLAWTDYPGESISGGALVNDLNLVVTGPDGSVHRGNDAGSNDFNGLPDLPLLTPDNINPWEVIYLADPTPGTYTVQVTAANLGSLALDPARKQGFALVVTGDLQSQQGRAEIEHPLYEVTDTAVARLRISDQDLNGNPAVVETVTAQISSDTHPDGIPVTLTEIGADSGIFAGQVVLTAVTPGVDELAVATGDTVHFTYADADDGRQGPATTGDTVRIGPEPLNFSNPPVLDDPGDTNDAGSFSLTWSAPEKTAGLQGYVIQETVTYEQPLFDDAEGSLAGNWSTDSLTNPWLQSPGYAASGLNSYWSGRGDTNIEINTSLTLNHDITIPATLSSAQLSFYSRYFNDFNDLGHIEISSDGGSSWAELRELYAAPRVAPLNPRLQYHQLDLTGYIGQSIRIRFRYDNAVLSVAPDSPGWYVDDIVINGGAWRAIATTAPDVRSLSVTGRPDGTFFYRVRGQYDDGSVSGWSNVADVMVANQPPPPPNSGGRATGGGWLATNEGGKINFGFQVGQEDGENAGDLKLNDKAAGVKIHLSNVTAVGSPTSPCDNISGENSLEVRGEGTFNGSPAEFRVCIQDNGQPGNDPDNGDRFYLACLSGCSYDSSDRGPDNRLGGGNIQVHEAGGGNGGSNASVLILNPILVDEGAIGALQMLTVAAYDEQGALLPGVGVTLERTSANGTIQTWTAVTTLKGLATFTLAILPGSAEFIAYDGQLASNAIVISGD